MAAGGREYRMGKGQALAIEEHEQAMTPIIKERGLMELELQRLMFEQKYEQAEKLNTLPMQLESRERALDQPVFMPAAAEKPAMPKKLVIVALVILALVFLSKRK